MLSARTAWSRLFAWGMVALRSSSLVSKTLFRIGVGSVLLIVAIIVTTYSLIFTAVEERGLHQLQQYVEERVKREKVRDTQIRDNLKIAAQAFLERYQAPDPPGYLDRFDERFVRYPDGGIRNRSTYGDGMRVPTLWVNKDTELTPEMRRRILIIYDVSNQFLPAWIGTFQSLYATGPEQFNLGFDASLPQWTFDTPGDRDQNQIEGELIMTQANNPERLARWTGPTVDPTYGDYLITLCHPVDFNGRHLANWCHDIEFSRLIDETVGDRIDDMMLMIFRDDDRLVAHPNKREEIVAANGVYSMQQDPILASLSTAIRSQIGDRFSGYDKTTRLYYAFSRIESAGWYFVVTFPRDTLVRQAWAHAQWVLWIGVGAIVILLAFLRTILRQGVAKPLDQLTLATHQLSEGSSTTEIEGTRTDELGQLASAFNSMARKVAERDTALRELNADLERRIEQRTAELQDSEARIRTMLEHAPEAIVVVDADTGKLADANDQALRLLGIDRARLETIDLTEREVVEPTTETPSTDSFHRHVHAAVTGKAPVFEWLCRTGDGTLVPTEVRLRLLPALKRRLVIGILTDISERKQAENSLLEALGRERELNTMKSDFVAMVSHEFRTPLGVISSSAEILVRYLSRLSEEQRATHLETIVRSTRGLSKVMEEVLLLGRVESKKLTFTPEPIDLEGLTTNLADEVVFSMGTTSSVDVQIKDDLGGATGDEGILRHILTNLLSNAVKYSPVGSVVRFRISRKLTHVVFEVIDRGIGISPEDMRTLFTAFHRGKNVGNRPGTGLGLVIVRRCAHLHGGEVQITSSPGQGTHVTVELPMFVSKKSSS